MPKKPMYIYKVYYTIDPEQIYDLFGIPDEYRPPRYDYTCVRAADADIAAHSVKEAADFADRHLIRKKGKKQGRIMNIQCISQVNPSRYY